MGLTPAYINFIQKCVEETLGDLKGKKMLELGNQHIAQARGLIREKTGKAYYANLGVEHISIDMNGKDGAIVLNLSKTIDRPEWMGYFDIITNAGTTEHVEPYESQYECFKNLHTWLKVGGIVIHINPAIEELESKGSWKNHCNNYYSRKFFEMLAQENRYEIIASTVINDLRSVCLRKRQEGPFMPDREKFLKHITRKDSGVVYFGINDQNIPFWEKVIPFWKKVAWRTRDLFRAILGMSP
jgi:hypothetical protein